MKKKDAYEMADSLLGYLNNPSNFNEKVFSLVEKFAKQKKMLLKMSSLTIIYNKVAETSLYVNINEEWAFLFERKISSKKAHLQKWNWKFKICKTDDLYQLTFDGTKQEKTFSFFNFFKK